MSSTNVKASGVDYFVKRAAYLALAKTPHDLIEKKFRVEVLPKLAKIDVDSILKYFYKDIYSELQEEHISVNDYLKTPIRMMETPKIREKLFGWKALADAVDEIRVNAQEYADKYDKNIITKLMLIDRKNRPERTRMSKVVNMHLITVFLMHYEFENLRTAFASFLALSVKWLIINGDLQGDDVFMEYINRAIRIIATKVSDAVGVDYNEIWALINKAMNTDFTLKL